MIVPSKDQRTIIVDIAQDKRKMNHMHLMD
jgi:hypothetical protein